MNKFEYTLQINKIKKMSTSKARENIMRKLIDKDSGVLNYWGISGKITDAYMYEYKCFIKAYTDYKGAHLPIFIHDAARRSTITLFAKAVEFEVTYNNLCDIFEFTPDIQMDRQHIGAFLPSFNRIIHDRVIPFNLVYSLSPSPQYTSITTGLPKIRNTATSNLNTIDVTTSILEIENIKQRLPSTVQYTVIEQLLNSLYGDASASVFERLTARIHNYQKAALIAQAQTSRRNYE